MRGRNTTMRRLHRNGRKHHRKQRHSPSQVFKAAAAAYPSGRKNTLGLSVSASARLTNFVALLQFSWLSGARVVDFEMSRPSIERPTERFPNGTHDTVCCVRMADLPTRLPRSGSFLQLRRERSRSHQQRTSQFSQLGHCEKTALT